ncbi:MAG: hypothetical protein KEFWMYNX_000074 [Candidatus Fervidibacter sp.]|jgi:hypothetical protein
MTASVKMPTPTMGTTKKTGRTSAEGGNSKVGLRKMSMRVA